MVFLEYRDHHGNDADYFITMSDEFGLKDLLNSHYEINNVYEVGNIIGFSDYSKNELGVEIYYKGQEENVEEIPNKSRTLFINNIEINILDQIFNILACVNVDMSLYDTIVDNMFKYVKTFISGVNFYDEEADNYITLAYGATEEWAIDDLIFQCVGEYMGFLGAIIKTHKKRIINELGCMDITQCVNNIDTGLILPTIGSEDIPTSVILYEYNTIETIHSTDMANMFNDDEDHIITLYIRYKLYAPKNYYRVVKTEDGYTYKQI